MILLLIICTKMRCFLEKFTQLARILHNRRLWLRDRFQLCLLLLQITAWILKWHFSSYSKFDGHPWEMQSGFPTRLWQPCSRTIKDIVKRRKEWRTSHYDFFSKSCSQVIADIETRIAHRFKLFLDSTVAKGSIYIFMFWNGIYLKLRWIITTINTIIRDIETEMAQRWLWGSDFRCPRRASQGLIKLKQGLDHRCKGCETRH